MPEPDPYIEATIDLARRVMSEREASLMCKAIEAKPAFKTVVQMAFEAGRFYERKRVLAELAKLDELDEGKEI